MNFCDKCGKWRECRRFVQHGQELGTGAHYELCAVDAEAFLLTRRVVPIGGLWEYGVYR